MSFNIGDKVRVCSEEAMERFANSEDKDYDIVDEMYDYCDTVWTVSSVKDRVNGVDGLWVRFEEDGEFYTFHEDLLELECVKVKDVKPNMCFKRHGYNLMVAVAGIINGKGEDGLNKVKLLMITNEANFGWRIKDNDGYFRDGEGIKYYDELRFQPKEGGWVSGWWYTFDADKTMEELLFTRIDSSKFVIDTEEEEEDEPKTYDEPEEANVDEYWKPTHVLHVASEVNDIVELMREAIKRVEMLKKLGFDVELADNKVSCSRNGVTYSVIVDNEVID